jgi:hypothetical protein
MKTKRLIDSHIWKEKNMKAIDMNNEQLLNHRNQVEKDFNRLYREDVNHGVETPLYEGLQYLNYLCNQRGISYK